MAEHVAWRGIMRLALVSCPVALHSARRSQGGLHFHFINPRTGHRVRNTATDAETEEEIDRADLVKGYAFAKDKYLLMDDADFEAARVESSSVLAIDKFIEAGTIDPLYYDASYYLVPDGQTGIDVYAVLREAFVQSGQVALSRIVIGRRERPVAIVPRDRGFMLHTLFQQREVVEASAAFEHVPALKADPEMIKLARQLIERQSGSHDPAADNEDRYETRLRQVIEAKLRGEGVEEPPPEPAQEDNVVDLMALLKQSLGGAGTQAAKRGGKAPARPRKAATPARTPRRRAGK